MRLVKQSQSHDFLGYMQVFPDIFHYSANKSIVPQKITHTYFIKVCITNFTPTFRPFSVADMAFFVYFCRHYATGTIHDTRTAAHRLA